MDDLTVGGIVKFFIHVLTVIIITFIILMSVGCGGPDNVTARMSTRAELDYIVYQGDKICNPTEGEISPFNVEFYPESVRIYCDSGDVYIITGRASTNP